MPDRIYEFCHLCNEPIDVLGQEFWLRHGRKLTALERKEFGMLCTHCIKELKDTHDKEKEATRKRIASALNRHE